MYTRLSLMLTSLWSYVIITYRLKEIRHIISVDKSYHDSTNNENSSQLVIVFIIYCYQGILNIGLGCRCIFYIMFLLRFHTICLYAKLIMSNFTYYIHVYYFQI